MVGTSTTGYTSEYPHPDIRWEIRYDEANPWEKMMREWGARMSRWLGSRAILFHRAYICRPLWNEEAVVRAREMSRYEAMRWCEEVMWRNYEMMWWDDVMRWDKMRRDEVSWDEVRWIEMGWDEMSCYDDMIRWHSLKEERGERKGGTQCGRGEKDGEEGTEAGRARREEVRSN